MQSIILFTIILTNIILTPVFSVSCKDEIGLDIPTWTIMKLPQSTDYYYYDTNIGFSYSPNSLNDTNVGALTYTVGQIWKNSINYMIYNDEPPNQTVYNFSAAHSKAIWIWDNVSAIIITHSIPKFPQGPKEVQNYSGLLQNAWEYGQAASCFSVSLTSLPTISGLIKQTLPLIYDEYCNNCFRIQQKLNTTSLPCSSYIIDGKYILFMKLGTEEVDIWASCIAPYFLSNVMVESWIHGTMDGSYCPPDYSHQTLDIQSVQFPGGESFDEYNDHSKWGILQNPIVCFGDLNRVITQKQRAGTVYCWKDSSLWNQLNSLIISTSSC